MDDLFHLFPDLPWPRRRSTAPTLEQSERVALVRRSAALAIARQKSVVGQLKQRRDVRRHELKRRTR